MTPSLPLSFFPPKIFPIAANQPFPAARMGFGELFKNTHGAGCAISTDGLANARMGWSFFREDDEDEGVFVCEQW